MMGKEVDIKKVRKSNKIEKTIDSEGKRIIIEHIKEWEEQGEQEKISKTPFADLSKKLKELKGYDFDSKAICDYWWNILDSRLNNEPFSQEEKNYIYERGEIYQKTNDKIRWTILQSEMKMKFGKFRSRNDLKNIWNIRKRQLQRINKTAEGKVVFSPFGVEHETRPFVKYSIQFLLNDDKNVENFENNDVGLVLPEMKKSNETLFSEEIDDKIIELMKEWGHLPSPYAKINEIIPEYTSKQIRRRWINKLNPELCPDPLNEEEKEFIIQGINNQLKLNPEDDNDKISWKDMISEMKIKFDKLHSENKVKNFWYANKKKRSVSK